MKAAWPTVVNPKTGRVNIATRNKIVLANAGLVWKMAFSLQARHGHHLTLDDMAQIGFLALIHAVELFDASRGLRFSTYACRSIALEIAKAATRSSIIKIPDYHCRSPDCEHGRKQRAKFQRCKEIAQSCGSLPKDCYLEAEPRSEMLDHLDDLAEAMKTLSEEDCELLHEKFWDEKNHQEIANELGLTREAVRIRMRNIVRKLRAFWREKRR